MKAAPIFETFSVHEPGAGETCTLIGCEERSSALLSIYDMKKSRGYSVSACAKHIPDLVDYLKDAELPR